MAQGGVRVGPAPGLGASLMNGAGGLSITSGSKMGLSGSINYASVMRTLSNLVVPPRATGQQLLREVEEEGRVIDYTDLLAEYTNRTVPLRARELTAALLNSRANIILTRVCPLVFTEENNFTVSKFEVLQLPFIRTAPGGIARTSGYRFGQRVYHLEQFKRAARIELGLLEDEIFGAQRLNETLGGVATGAEMTLGMMAVMACVDVPYAREMQKLSHPTRSINHTRQLMQESYRFGLAHAEPAELLHVLLRQSTQFNPKDTIVMPEGTTALLADLQGQSRPMRCYKIEYDTKLRDYLIKEYDGSNSFKTLTQGNGTTMDITEAPAFRYSADDPEELTAQALRANVVLGTVAFMPRNRDSTAPCTGDPRVELNVALADHTPSQIQWREIRYAEALEASAVFRNRNGELQAGGGPSDVLTDLAAYYTATRAGEVRQFFRDVANHNNKCPREELQSGHSLNLMTRWRDICGLVYYDDATGKVEVPKLVGDLEEKTLPPWFVHNMARCLAQLPNGVEEITSLFTWDVVGLDNPVTPHEGVAAQKRNDAEAKRLREEREAANAAARKFKLSSSSLSMLAPLAGESAAAFAARVTPDAMRAAAADQTLGAGHSAWAHLLAHVPDSALGDFLALAYEVQKEGRTLSPADESALASLATELQRVSGTAMAAEVLKRARANADDLSKYPALGRPWLDGRAEQQANARPAPTKALASHVAQHLGASSAGQVDAMEIDAPASDSFGAFIPAERQVGGAAARSWAAHHNYVGQTGANGITDDERKIYAAIVQAPFTLQTCLTLARFGLKLFNYVYVRPFGQFFTSAISVLQSGPQTMFMALGHAICVAGLEANQGYVTFNAQFRAGVVPPNPDGLSLLAYAIIDRLEGGRNTQFVTNLGDLYVPNVHRPALLALPVPVTETEYVAPLNLLNEAPFRAPNAQDVVPHQKASIADFFRMFAGDDLVDELSLFRLENGTDPSYWDSVRMATTLHQDCAGYYNAQKARWIPAAGTGPIGAINRNLPDSINAYNSLGRFPTNFDVPELLVH